MDQSQALSTAVSQIAGFETFSASPYWDVNGYAIGYGNHYYEDGSAVSADDDPIDENRAMQILTFYANQFMQVIISKLTVPQNENQVAALTDIAYNGGSVPSALYSLINSGADIPTVQAQINKTYTTSAGVVSSDLVARRASDAQLYGSAGGVSSTMILIGAGVVIALGLFALLSRD